MKRLHELTQEQQVFAEENHPLVMSFLRKNRLEESEFYDVVIFGYLGAVQEYLERPELSKYRFSSIAWMQMKDCMIKEFIYRNCPKRKAFVGDYHEDYDSESWNGQFESQTDDICGVVDNQMHIGRLMLHMTPKEKEVVRMRTAGYSYREIAEACSITIRAVSARLERMRKRFKLLALV